MKGRRFFWYIDNLWEVTGPRGGQTWACTMRGSRRDRPNMTVGTVSYCYQDLYNESFAYDNLSATARVEVVRAIVNAAAMGDKK